MKKNIIKTAIFLVLLSQITLALDDIDCFKYYEYGTGVVFRELMTDQKTYAPGESAVITYSVLSQMNAPITEGSVRMDIFYNDPVDGEQIVDELYAVENINLKKGSQADKRTVWDVPIGARSGNYTIKTFFVVGKYFNLAGLTGAPYGAPAELVNFQVKEPANPDALYWSKKDTTVNGEAYDFSAPPKVYNGTISLKTKLVNIGGAKEVKVLIQSYVWDDLSEKSLSQYTQEKTITLPANGAQDFSYDLSGLEASTYEIKLSAETEDSKSILKVRTPVGGAKGMILFLGLDKFPLAKDDETAVFACYSTATDWSTSFAGTLKLEVLDEKGNTITQDTGTVSLAPTPPQGKKLSFMPPGHNTVTVKASLWDDKNNLQDTATITYDYSDYVGAKGDLTLVISPKTVTDGSDVTYTVSYKDNAGTPLNGKILVFMSDPKDKVIGTLSDIEIKGQYTGKFKVSGTLGDYKITVRELVSDKNAEGSFKVGVMAEATTTTEPPVQIPEETTTTEPYAPPVNAQPNYLPIIAIVVVIALIAILLMRRKKK